MRYQPPNQRVTKISIPYLGLEVVALTVRHSEISTAVAKERYKISCITRPMVMSGLTTSHDVELVSPELRMTKAKNSMGGSQRTMNMKKTSAEAFPVM